MVIDLSLRNKQLYDGCAIESVGGRDTLMTSPVAAMQRIGRNLDILLEAVPANERRVVTLTGPMAVWAYLVVFHMVVHRFTQVYYDDGKGNTLLIAAHGPVDAEPVANAATAPG